MSSSYTFHVPADALPGQKAALDRAEVVRDGFSWGAFLVPFLWFGWHRHWLPAIAALVVVVGGAAALAAAGVPAREILVAELLVHFLFGLEGASLRRFDYARRGRLLEDLVIAGDTAEAESKAFARWLENPARPAEPPPVPQRPFRSGSVPVIGLFPDREGRP
jgi:hypothetical protein